MKKVSLKCDDVSSPRKNTQGQLDKLKRTLKRKEEKLGQYENLLIELDKEEFSKENIDKSIQESSAYINGLYSILQRYKKITKRPALDQLKMTISRFNKGICANKETIIDFRVATQKLDKLIIKYSTTKTNINFIKTHFPEILQSVKKSSTQWSFKIDYSSILEAFMERYNENITYFIKYHDNDLSKKKKYYKQLLSQRNELNTSIPARANEVRLMSNRFIKNQKKEIFDKIENSIIPITTKAQILLEVVSKYQFVENEQKTLKYNFDIEPLRASNEKAYKAGNKRAEKYAKNAQAIHDQEIEEKKKQLKKEMVEEDREFKKAITEEDPEIIKLKRYKLALEHMNSHKDRFPVFSVSYSDYPGKQS